MAKIKTLFKLFIPPLAILILDPLSRKFIILGFLYKLTLISIFVLFVLIVLAFITDLNIFQCCFLNRKKSKDSPDTPPYLKIKFQEIEVNYSWKLHGGGIILAHEFARVVSQKIGKVKHVFEYGAGPGFIGFCLLANNLCDQLTLADINPKAIDAINETIKNNHLQDKVTVYQSDCLDSIPESEQWDLVVSNPPWQLTNSLDQRNKILRDPRGRVHAKFYQDIHKFLKPKGSILFAECGEYTNSSHFKDMIEKNGLKITESFKSVTFLKFFQNLDKYKGIKIPLIMLVRTVLFLREIYFIHSKRKEAVNV